MQRLLQVARRLLPNSTRGRLALAVLTVVVAGLGYVGVGDTGQGDDSADTTTSTSVEVTVERDGGDVAGDPGTSEDTADTPTRFSDLPTVTLDELPSEAIDVLSLIEDGGPYDYRQDDSVFGNREGILPDR